MCIEERCNIFRGCASFCNFPSPQRLVKIKVSKYNVFSRNDKARIIKQQKYIKNAGSCREKIRKSQC